jgi:putative peptide zinc metalloprotease protein
VITIDSYCLNPKLIVSELADSCVAVYAPPDPTPYRLTNKLWLSLQAWEKETKSVDQWKEHLFYPGSTDGLDHDLQGLLDKNILIPAHISDDQLPVEPSARESSEESADRQFPQAGQGDDDIGESVSINLIKINPLWPDWLRYFFLSILRLQIKLLLPVLLIIFGYLLFLVFAPASSSLNFYSSISEIDNNFDVLIAVLIGLLSVNLVSTFTTWLAQSVTRTGDGRIVLRFLFGFIPRLGVNPYSGPALRQRQWTAESSHAFLCIAQPLLVRLTLSAILIVLLASGRLHGGLAGSQLYSLANVVLQISLISFLILALPFRMSPGYRLMILLTDLPPSTLGRSVSHLYLVLTLLSNWIKNRDQESEVALKATLSSKRDVGLVLFALVFFGLVVAKLIIIVYFVIPRLASGLPAILGGASEYIFAIILFALLWRFLRITIVPKLTPLKSKTLIRSRRQIEDAQDYLDSSQSLSPPNRYFTRLKKNRVLLLLAGAILVVPIDRTITGSVVVSSERDLTVRAPDDVSLVAVFQKGPSSEIIGVGTPLAELQSAQLERDLFQISSDLVDLKKSLDGLEEDLKANQKVLLEVKKSLDSYKKAGKIIKDQLIEIQQLSVIGAVSKQAAQELLLQSYELQEEERLKIQKQMELEADLQETGIKIKAAEQSLAQSLEWQRSLLSKKKDLMIVMPFDGLITSTTSGLMGSFFAKGDTLLELREGSLQVVNVLVPDHDRALIQVNQEAAVRLYANPNQSLTARVQSIRPSSELIDEKVYFQVSLRLEEPLSPNLLQSSGAARIKSGSSNLFLLMLSSIDRFVRVDMWSWMP